MFCGLKKQQTFMDPRSLLLFFKRISIMFKDSACTSKWVKKKRE